MANVCGESIGKNWTSIGDKTNEFKGIFDGKNHKISNLYQVNNNSNKNGLFGNLGENGVIKGINLENVTISNTGYYSNNLYIGGIVAINNGTVMQCATNSGNLTGIQTNYPGSVFLGGIVGTNNGNIQECSNRATCFGNQNSKEYIAYIGGMAGYSSENGKISFCYNLGEIKSTKTGACVAGGIVGNSFGEISNVYVKCAINISGITYSSSAGVDSIVGKSSGTIQNEFYNTNLNSNKTEAEMKTEDFVVSLNNGNNVFKFIENDYPKLKWEK